MNIYHNESIYLHPKISNRIYMHVSGSFSNFHTLHLQEMSDVSLTIQPRGSRLVNEYKLLCFYYSTEILIDVEFQNISA